MVEAANWQAGAPDAAPGGGGTPGAMRLAGATETLGGCPGAALYEPPAVSWSRPLSRFGGTHDWDGLFSSLGMVLPGHALTVTGAAQAADDLTWRPVRTTLADGSTVEGWCAQATADEVLLGTQPPTNA